MSDERPVMAGAGASPSVATDPVDEQQGLGEATTPEVLPASGALRTVMQWLGRMEQAAGVVLLGVILTLVLLQVVQRYLPGGGWAWTGEVARFAMVWVTFFLAGYLMAHDQHIAIKVVDYVLPARALGAVKLFGHALVAVTCVALVYATYDFMTHDRGQVTPAAQIPLAVIYVVVAFGFASTALRALVAMFVQDLPEIRTGQKAAT